MENPAPISCPSGFIPVPHNTDVGTTSDFCVMKYEAKDNGGVAASQAAGNPIVNIDAVASQTKCTDLGANYDLISNPEWMTIARNAESVSSNFQAGVMARGWAAHITYGDAWLNSAVAPSTNTNCLYNTGANTCASSGDHLYRRTLALSNGEVIWDFSGNVWEWVDWETGGAFTTVPQEDKAFDGTDGTAVASYREFTLLDQNINNGDVMDPLTWQSSNPALNSANGIGQYYASTSGGAARRGARWDGGSQAGAFALNLSSSTTSSGPSLGFRCVYRP